MIPSPTELRAARKVLNAYRAERRRKLKASKPPRVEKAGQEPRKREPAYLQWIRRLPCVACLARGKVLSPIEAAHVRCGFADAGWRPTGMSEKPSDRRTVPLCRYHHRDGPPTVSQHSMNERAWWHRLGIHPPEFCAALSKAYDEDRDGTLVVQMFASVARGRR